MTAVLFDLDGTLVDTAHDLGYALNLLRARYELPAIPHDEIWPVASHGSKGLLALGFNLKETDEDFKRMVDEYLSLYQQVLTRNPIFLTGVEYVLKKLTQDSIPWGIVTNKPRRFSVPLVQSVAFQGGSLFDHAQCLVCGDDAPHPKPSPETLLIACKKMQVNPAEVIYVGDAERDVEAGRAANMTTVVALFGYLAAHDKPEEWGADHLINEASELLEILKS